MIVNHSASQGLARESGNAMCRIGAVQPFPCPFEQGTLFQGLRLGRSRLIVLLMVRLCSRTPWSRLCHRVIRQARRLAVIRS